jgi:hypothetical protein
MSYIYLNVIETQSVHYCVGNSTCHALPSSSNNFPLLFYIFLRTYAHKDKGKFFCHFLTTEAEPDEEKVVRVLY